MYPEGENRHRHVTIENGKEGKRESNKNGREGKLRRHLGTRVRRFRVRKEKVIRVESEETQSLNLSREKTEEISFVPSALSIPRGLMFWCDNRCSDQALSFRQFASVVIDDVEESHTVNLCQQCYSERLKAQG